MRKAMFLLLCVPLLTGSAWLSQNDRNVERGQKAYSAQEYKNAARHFRNAMGGSGNPDLLQFDLGTALTREALGATDPGMRERTLKLAIVSLRSALDSSNAKVRLDAAYNVGNALLLAQRYDEAIESYKSVLREDSTREFAKHNLELAQYLRRSELSLDEVESKVGLGGSSGDVDRVQGGDAANGPAQGSDDEAGSEAGAEQSSDAAAAGSGTGREGGNAAKDGADDGDSPGMRAEPRSMAAPNGAVSSDTLRKLDALERRSGELRRRRILRKTQEMAEASRSERVSP